MIGDTNEDPAVRARKYISSFEKTLGTTDFVNGPVNSASQTRVSDAIHRYLRDAKYYLEANRPTTALASIAYAEGLLDALVFLNLAKKQAQ